MRQSPRTAPAARLGRALQDARADTLSTYAQVAAQLPRDAGGGPRVPQRPTLNPPLWELGHIGWFQAWWIARNPQRARGVHADPDAPRNLSAGVRPDADALYDSSRVAHDTRWGLALPSPHQTHADLALQLQDTLSILAGLPQDADDHALYFARLALLHEDMHHEAALYMAQALDLAIDDPRWQPRPTGDDGSELWLPGGSITLGTPAAARLDPGDALPSATCTGFAFDNECGQQTQAVPPTRMDRHLVSWGRYLPFVEQGGYAQPQWWTAQGWAWMHDQGLSHPQVLRRHGSGWQRRRYGRWQALELQEAAVHLSAHEAQAWCRWAGRQLPTEAQWVHAVQAHPDSFAWGQVWEWTASAFLPFEGFWPHPYRDYSAPFFDGRPVLRGASFATQPRLRDWRYRNYFGADRTDIFAGFRSCAPG